MEGSDSPPPSPGGRGIRGGRAPGPGRGKGGRGQKVDDASGARSISLTELMASKGKQPKGVCPVGACSVECLSHLSTMQHLKSDHVDVADADVSALMVKWSDDVASRAAGGVAEEIWCPEPGCVYSMHPGEGRTLKALKGLLTVFNHVCLKHVPEHLWTDICVCSKRCPTAKALKSHESTCAEAGGSAFAFKCKCGKDFKKQAAFDKHVAKMTSNGPANLVHGLVESDDEA